MPALWIARFPDVDSAVACNNSDKYQAVVEKAKAARNRSVVIDEIDD